MSYIWSKKRLLVIHNVLQNQSLHASMARNTSSFSKIESPCFDGKLSFYTSMVDYLYTSTQYTVAPLKRRLQTRRPWSSCPKSFGATALLSLEWLPSTLCLGQGVHQRTTSASTSTCFHQNQARAHESSAVFMRRRSSSSRRDSNWPGAKAWLIPAALTMGQRDVSMVRLGANKGNNMLWIKEEKLLQSKQQD